MIKSPRWLLLVCATAILATFGELRLISRVKRETEAARVRVQQLQEQNRSAKQRYDATLSDVVLAEHEIAELRSLAGGRMDPGRETEIKAWLTRVKELKRKFQEHPDQKIPEMNLLTDEDWIRVGRWISFSSEDETRAALASVRTAATTKYMEVLTGALRKYRESSGGRFPPVITDLAPFLANPDGAPALSRYQMTGALATSPTDNGAHAAVIEVSAVDPDYDSRLQINSNGGTVLWAAPVAWIEDYRERQVHAYQAYANANSGARAPSMAELVPYFDPPLDPVVQRRLIKRDQSP